MSYDAKETSQQDGNPVRLIQFACGSQTWRYVAAPESLTKDGNSWTPEAVTSGNLVQAGDIPKDQIEIHLPISNPVAASFLSYAPDAITAVTVFRTNYDDSDVRAIWMGRVMSSQTSVATVTLVCEPIFNSLRRLGLHATYQRLCRHVLYGPGCNVNPTGYAMDVTVSAVQGALITLATSGLSPNFKGGTLKAPDGTIFFIIDVSSSVLTLMRQSMVLAQQMVAHPSGFTVTLYPGCDHSTTGCTSFGNIGNFGGFPGIPRINPFSNSANIF